MFARPLNRGDTFCNPQQWPACSWPIIKNRVAPAMNIDTCIDIYSNDRNWVVVHQEFRFINYIPLGHDCYLNVWNFLIIKLLWSSEKMTGKGLKWWCARFHSVATCNMWKTHLDVNSLRPEENGCNFKCLEWKLLHLLQILEKFVLEGPIKKRSSLVRILVWCCQASSHYFSQCLPR